MMKNQLVPRGTPLRQKKSNKQIFKNYGSARSFLFECFKFILKDVYLIWSL